MSPIRLRGSWFPLAAPLGATKRGGVRGIFPLTSGATLLSLSSGATLLSLSS